MLPYPENQRVGLLDILKTLPYWTTKMVFYLLESIWFFGSRRRNHFRTLGRNAADRADLGPLRGSQAQYQAIGIKYVLSGCLPL